MNQEVTSNLQEKRVEKRFTRPQLAELVGVTWEAIKAYEVKGALPSLPVALKLEKYLETPINKLFTLEEQEQIQQAK